MLLLTQSESTAARRRVPFYLVDETDGKTPETGVTLSAGDMKLSKNGAAEGNHAGTWTELAAGHYYYEATAGELDTLGYWMARLTKTGVRTFIAVAQVLAVNLYDAVRAGLTALPNAAAEAAGGLFTRGSGAGQINQSANGQVDSKTVAMAADVVTAAAIATDAIDADALKADAVAEIQSGVALASALATAQTAITDIQGRLPAALDGGFMKAQVKGMDAGTVNAAAIATDAIDADAIKTDAVTELQAGLATAVAVAAVQTDVDDLQARLPAALVGGKMDSHVNDIAANAVNASALAADAATEIAAAVAAPSAATVASAVRTELTTELGRIDAAVSTRLATSGYTAPPSAAAIRAEMDANSVDLDAIGVLATSIQADTDDIQGRLPAALVGGKIDSHVNDIAAGAITATAMAADAITAAKVAADVATEIAAAVAVPSAAAIRAEMDANSTKLAHLQADLTATPPTAAQVRAEMDSNSTKLAHLDADVSDCATPSDVPTADQNADAYLDRADGIETGVTPRQAMQRIGAVVGKSSGEPNATYYGLDGVTPRVKFTVDGNSNRTAAEFDP